MRISAQSVIKSITGQIQQIYASAKLPSTKIKIHVRLAHSDVFHASQPKNAIFATPIITGRSIMGSVVALNHTS